MGKDFVVLVVTVEAFLEQSKEHQRRVVAGVAVGLLQQVLHKFTDEVRPVGLVEHLPG